MFTGFVPALPVLAAYAVASVVLGLTPGPDMTFFLSRTIAQSRAPVRGAVRREAWFSSFIPSLSPPVVGSARRLGDRLHCPQGRRRALPRRLAYDAIRYGSALSLETRERPGRSVPSISRG